MEPQESAVFDDQTLDFILSYTKDAPRQQLLDVASLETKMIQVLTTGSVVIGLAGLSTSRTQFSSWALTWLVFGLVAYFLLAATTIWQLWPRGFRISSRGADLWRRTWDLKPSDVKHALVQDIADACSENAITLSTKKDRLLVGLVFLSVEVALIGLSILISLRHV